MRFDASKFEPLLDDDRVERLQQRVMSALGHRWLRDAAFFTFIQPARPYNARTPAGIVVPTWIPEMAVFAVKGKRTNPDPKRPNQELVSTGTASLADWRDAEAEAGHYVSGNQDPAFPIFKAVARDFIAKQESAKELIRQ